MKQEDRDLLENDGWTIVCEYPFEIKYKDGSIATHCAAHMVLSLLKKEKYDNRSEDIPDEELKTRYDCYYTVGDLMEFIYKNNIPRDGKILVQRVEDMYYQENHWSTVKRGGEGYHYALEHNKKIDSGEYLDKEQYPKIQENDEFLKKYTEEELHNCKDQYSPVWCPVFYSKEDPNNLYLDLHY